MRSPDTTAGGTLLRFVIGKAYTHEWTIIRTASGYVCRSRFYEDGKLIHDSNADPVPGPGGVIGRGRRKGQRKGAEHRQPKDRRKAKRKP